MIEVQEILDHAFLGVAAWQWALAATIAVATFAVLLLVRRLIRSNYARLAATAHTELMELPLKVAGRTTVLFLLIIAVFLGVQSLELPPKLHRVLLTITTIASFWQVGLWTATATLVWLDRKRMASMQHDRAAVGSLSIIAFIARTLIWALVLLLTLDNLGINITTLVAGLGIGGIAVALAVQNVLGDLLASLSITLDRPFVVGDFLVVDDFMGSVEYIGIKSVRLRSLGGEQIVIPNSNLLSSRIRNFTRMSERRVLFTINVAYETPRDKLETIAATIRAIIEAQENVRFDRCHFAKFGPASLDFEAVYYALTPEYNRYMDIQQSINFRIFEAFERDGIEFAYPTQKLWLQRVSTEKSLHGGHGEH